MRFALKLGVTLGLLAVVTAALAEESPVTGSPPAQPPPARVHSRAERTFIYAEPRRSQRWIGYLRVGQSVPLREAGVQRGPGCGGGFVAIEPYGYVCLDRTASLDNSDRLLRAMELALPRSQPLPFKYALSNGTPMYSRLPGRDEWRREERFLGPPGTHGALSWGNRGHERLAEVRELLATDPLPFFLEGGGSAESATARGLVRRQIPLGSMLAYTRVVAHEGRAFAVSSDGTVVPADRLRPYRPSSFVGVKLGQEAELPLAWIRARPRVKYRRGEQGRFVDSALRWGTRSWIELEPALDPVTVEGKTYLPTRDRDRGKVLWIEEADATVVRPLERLPWGATEHDKWVLVSITRGTLVAYQGQRPVYTTLISPGAGGVPIKGRNPVKMSTTPLGTYRIHLKHVAADMSPESGDQRSFWIAEVPWTQYFNPPFALHTAYWHEEFGEPMSAGCINLSPRDGRWLFGWTDPQVPAAWGGAGPSQYTGRGSVVVVTR